MEVSTIPIQTSIMLMPERTLRPVVNEGPEQKASTFKLEQVPESQTPLLKDRK